ncbi:hypothetical protein AAFF_G00346570 [Aldrovandia affinis]|uniref:Uncharacterized protein n=1 Tax=Aldrovandia affinis TaxID=143900 RepID=A0AAD7SJH9_9TELE|nr:hypothetical protein AAFF_G00346570 [Aldrovandia affinis]
MVLISHDAPVFQEPAWGGIAPDTLARIIQYIEDNYKRVDTDGHELQYAVAINVPSEQCESSFAHNTKNFLRSDDPKNVKNAYGTTESLYQKVGTELIAAGTKLIQQKKIKYNKHSESILLNPPENSPTTHLLNKYKPGCVVFYTFNSPCVDSCINENQPQSILRGLEILGAHSGPKAFVFKHFWKFDTEKDLKSKFKLLANRLPLYRCVSGTKCVPCGGDGTSEVAAGCLPEK